MLIRSSLLVLIWLCSSCLRTGDVHWGYAGREGPSEWGQLAPEFDLCETGMNQSPVDVVVDYDAALPELRLDYQGSPLRLIHNGHTVQENVQPGNWLELETGERYALKRFHFHSPSEHRVAGRSYAMEVHLVHQGDRGDLLVVGVLFEEGEEHPVLGTLWAFMPEHPGEEKSDPTPIEATGLLPTTRDYYAYNGSLTTPPCSEGVQWVIRKQPMEASREQIVRFREVVGAHTNRPVQPRNARAILE